MLDNGRKDKKLVLLKGKGRAKSERTTAGEG